MTAPLSKKQGLICLQAGPGFFPTTLVGTSRMILLGLADKPKEKSWPKINVSPGESQACSTLA